jgi:hypothetical protein
MEEVNSNSSVVWHHIKQSYFQIYSKQEKEKMLISLSRIKRKALSM